MARETVWQPIETAPRSNERIDIWLVSKISGATMRLTECSWEKVPGDWFSWHSKKYVAQTGYEATHWMPVPTGPAEKK